MTKPATTLSAFLRQCAAAHAERPALSQAGRALSYRDLKRAAHRLGTGFRAAFGAGPLILLCESGPHWLTAFFGAILTGQPVAPLHPETPLPVLAFLYRFMEAAGIVYSDRFREPIQTLPPEFRTLSLQEAAIRGGESRAAAAPATRPHAVALLVCTSGSTQAPRVVALTHRNLLSNLHSFLSVRQAGSDDVFLSLLPPTHLFELLVGQLIPLACGARIVYAPSLLPNRILQAFRDEGVTYALVVPGLLKILIQEGLDELVEADILDPRWAQADEQALLTQLTSANTPDATRALGRRIRALVGSRLKSLVVGGAAPHPDWPRILAAVGVDLAVGYGLTEASPVVALGSARECPVGSVGRILPGIQARISREGELLVKGPNVMRGYLKAPGETRTTLRAGWLRTGDSGRFDEQGFLFIAGRLKEAMVNENGDTLYPEELEPWYRHAAFREWAVVPCAGPHGNDRPLLAIIPRDRRTAPDALRRAFHTLRRRAPARLRVLDFRVWPEDAFPRTALGKPKRRDIARLLAQPQEVP